MSIRLEVECAMCGVNAPASKEAPNDQLYFNECAKSGLEGLRKMLEAEGWIVQFNDIHIDVYCSKDCT